jgi:4-hydroxy-tetrahydrodipicolinate synthase
LKELIFKGAGVAIVTPFNEDGIDFKELARLIDFNIDHGTDAIVITGTTGESATMSDQEHKEAIKFTVEHVNKRVPVIAGTGSNDTVYAVQLSEYAQSVGADALLVVTPYYNKCSQRGLITHFRAIADKVNIPIILYNVPSRTGVCIAVDSFVELAKHPNIVAVKEASGDLSAVAKIRYACGDDLAIYSGNDDQIVPILSLGGAGVISVLSNVMPQETHDICQLYFDGKVKESSDLQIKLLDLINNLFIDVNPIPVKMALREMGFKVGELRLPLTDMEDAKLAKLKASMKSHGIL